MVRLPVWGVALALALSSCGPTLPRGVSGAELEALTEIEVPAADPSAPLAEELLARHIEATGMRAVLEGSRSVRIDGTAEALELGVLGDFEALRARPARTRLLLRLPSLGEVLSGCDGERAWMVHPVSGVEVFDGAAQLKACRSAVYDHLLRRPDGLEAYLTVGRTRFGGRECYEVFGLHAAEDARQAALGVRERSFREFYSVDTGLLAGIIESSRSSNGAVEVTSRYEDYAAFGGSLVATRTVQRSPGFELVLTVESVVYDDVDDDQFELPGAVEKALGR